MTVTVADGPLGLEAIHGWVAGDGVTTIDLNDRTASPRVVLDEITGLYDLPDADDLREQNTGRRGESLFPSFERGKTVNYAGRIQAATLQDLRTLSTQVRAAFQERNLEGTMVLTPDPAYGSIAWFYRARVIGLSIPEKQDRAPTAQPGPWQRDLLITLRLSDGRFYLAGDPDVEDSLADGATQPVTNAGRAPTEPFIAGNLTDTTVLIENLSIARPDGNAFLQFADLPDADSLAVDFATRTAWLNGPGSTVRDAMPYLTPESDWWDELVPGLDPGVNQVRAYGLSSWSVTWRTASP